MHAGLSAQDKQINKDLGSVSQQNKELAISIGMGGLVTFAILSSSVTAFFATQISVDKSNIASQLAPLLGDNAALFFGIGLFAAGLTSALTAPLAAAFAISGLFGWGNTLKDLRFKATAISIVAIGTFAASLGLKPLALIILAQTSNALLLPISAILLVWVCNRPDLMGNYANSKLANIAGGLVILLVLMLAAYKLFG